MLLVVDENDNIVDTTKSKKFCHLNKNDLPLHRAFSIFIFDKDDRLLLQKRSEDKITFPGCWANTCCLASAREPCARDGRTLGSEEGGSEKARGRARRAGGGRASVLHDIWRLGCIIVPGSMRPGRA